MSNAITFSFLANRLRDAMKTVYPGIKLGHANEILAAAFGYKSRASMQASNLESAAYDEVHHWILQDSLILSRALALGLKHDPQQLVKLVHQTIDTHLPTASIYPDLERFIEGLQEWVDERVNGSGSVNSAVAQTNHDGLGETYVPLELSFDALSEANQATDIEVLGHVTVEPDLERPYAGHKIKVKAQLTMVRLSQFAIGKPKIRVQAHVDYDWSGASNSDPERGPDDEPYIPLIPLEVKLAEELNIDVEDAEELADIEPLENASNDGLIYGFDFHFDDVSPELRAKILENYGSLHLRVGPNFYDDVRTNW